MNNYLPFPDTSKLLMVFLMWIGRLEISTILVLLTRASWPLSPIWQGKAVPDAFR